MCDIGDVSALMTLEQSIGIKATHAFPFCKYVDSDTDANVSQRVTTCVNAADL